jgi:uncharacterized protein YbbC (DUF1343 family)
VDAGRVALDDPVARHVPEFAAHGKEGVTVEDLLLHRGGLAPANALAEYAHGPQAALAAIFASAPRAAPGASFGYSDLGYVVLGALVARVSGRPLERFCAEELFAPLGMTRTGFLPSEPASCAPTEHDGGAWLRGVVHDPRARALGGVAGHAGLFGTADDLACWCRMLLAGGRGVLSPATVAEMTRPRWLPDGTGGRALGLDVDTAYSSARGAGFPRGASYGHTGFTGTSLWIDPGSGVFVVLLTSRLHPDGTGDVRALRAAVADAVWGAAGPAPARPAVLAGIDVLRAEGFARLAGRRVGLVTNQTGRAADGARTLDLLHAAPDVELVRVLTPEHGFGADAEGAVADARDAASGLPLCSLYGETRRPTPAMLAGLDVLVVDLQDAGVRFYTYSTTLGYVLEEAGAAGVPVLVLDRPNPLGGHRVAGPPADASRRSFICYQRLPVEHGLTLGELARLFVSAYDVRCDVEVVAMRGWRRGMGWDETGLAWIPPSPNLRNPTQALLYPALGLLEACNVSVGRGSDEPFERLAAPWIDGVRLAAALNADDLPGLAFTPVEYTPDASRFAGERCSGVQLTVLDRDALRPTLAGLAIARRIDRLFGVDFEAARIDDRLAHRATWEAWMRGVAPADLEASWERELEAFRTVRAPCLLYP